MGLLYKPDWEETKQRYLAWWSGEYLGRCALAVTAPRNHPTALRPPPAPADPVQRWTDLDYLAVLNDYAHATTFYGGEAFPVWHGGYPGHTSIPAFLGCPVTLDERTGWWDPLLIGDEWDATSLEIAPDNRWWRFANDLLHAAAAASAGKSIPSIGALGGCGDTLAALRGTDRLLLDVTDSPDKVRAAELWLMDMWCRVYEGFYQIIRFPAQGSTCWFALWAPGRFYAAQCDFSYMISPRMFRDLFLPALARQTEFLDYSIYHVDGIGAFVHLPALLELPRLQAIQILPGAGKPSPLHYLDQLKQVQAAGKNLHITIPPEEVETALSLLSATGLFIETWCQSEDEARDLLRMAERCSRP